MGVIVAVVIGIAVLTGAAVLLAVTEHAISDEPVDRLDPGLPDGPISAADIPRLRFRIGLRGYRMDDVDAALARIQDSLAEADGSGAEADGSEAEAEGSEADDPTPDPADHPVDDPADHEG